MGLAYQRVRGTFWRILQYLEIYLGVPAFFGNYNIRGNPFVDFSWNLDTCSGKSSTGARPALFKASRMPNVLYLEGQRGVISRSLRITGVTRIICLVIYNKR